MSLDYTFHFSTTTLLLWPFNLWILFDSEVPTSLSKMGIFSQEQVCIPEAMFLNHLKILIRKAQLASWLRIGLQDALDKWWQSKMLSIEMLLYWIFQRNTFTWDSEYLSLSVDLPWPGKNNSYWPESWCGRDWYPIASFVYWSQTLPSLWLVWGWNCFPQPDTEFILMTMLA